MSFARHWAWLLLAAVLVVGCSSGEEDEISDTSDIKDDDSGAAADELTGDVEIDGSSTVYPISEAAADEFRKEYANVNVTVAVSGTGGGFKRFSKGETDISNASRPIKLAEFEQCQSENVEFIELPVAYDGLTIVVNTKNDWVDQMTVAQLQKIFLEKGAAKNWSDVDPSWPVEPIKIYAPGADSGTFDYFKEVVADDDGAMRSDMSVSEDDNVLVTGVANEKNAIGFFGAAYYFENKDKLKAVSVVNPKTDEAVLPSDTTIEDGSYAPFSRPLFIYVNADSIKRPEIKKFVGFYLENAGELSKSAGYVALPRAVYAGAQKHFEDRMAGTHYLTTDGEKRSGALPDVYKADNLVK